MNTILYTYDGPVLHFGKVVSEKWHGETMATSEAQAKNNLCYKFKEQNNFVKNTKIELFNRPVPHIDVKPKTNDISMFD